MTLIREDEDVVEDQPIHLTDVDSIEEDGTYWEDLSWDKNIDFQLIIENLDKPWNWNCLSLYRTWEEIQNNPTLPWDYYEVSRNQSVNENIVLQNQDFPWDFEGLSQNSNISIDFMISRPAHNWSWKEASFNISITIEHVIAHMELPWDWKILSGFNSSITMNVIEAHMELPWDWDSVMYNRTFNQEFVTRHPELGLNPSLVNHFLANGDGEEFERLESLRLQLEQSLLF